MIRKGVFKMCDNLENNEKKKKAREFCREVQALSKKYNLPFFFVTDGASAVDNNGNEAIRYARECHRNWEMKHHQDPDEDWSL